GQEMTPEAKTSDPEVESLVSRLKRVEGQIRGIQRMLEEDRVCEDIVTQVMAARTALDQVSVRILDHHIQRCMCADAEPDEAMKSMQHALKLWMRLGAPQAGDESD
ncbi:MAG: metal-sensitive transcriptional regulator, partial [Chloroflexota bacterium]